MTFTDTEEQFISATAEALIVCATIDALETQLREIGTRVNEAQKALGLVAVSREERDAAMDRVVELSREAATRAGIEQSEVDAAEADARDIFAVVDQLSDSQLDEFVRAFNGSTV